MNKMIESVLAGETANKMLLENSVVVKELCEFYEISEKECIKRLSGIGESKFLKKFGIDLKKGK